MLLSHDRILTTHVGSLPRSAVLNDLLVRRETGETIDQFQLAAEVEQGVAQIVERQSAAGIDIGNDGEQSRVGFQTYVPQRMTGFGGESQRPLNRELAEIPELVEMQRLRFPRRGRNRNAPAAIGDVRYLDTRPIEQEIARIKSMSAGKLRETFMTAPSPGIIATTLMNQHYDSDAAYLAALAREISHEYQAIHRGGLILQIDAPDLAMSRSINFQDKSDTEFVAICEAHVAAINTAIEGIPRECVRLHVCWGNWDGPHIYDIALAQVLPVLVQANVGALSLELANPRHAHEYGVIERMRLPKHMALLPGLVESTSNYVEHPEVVAQRIMSAVAAVGDRERVIASTDCGFGTFAGREYVVAPVVWLKLAALRAGADLASARLWGKR
ncbi:MAG: cobalamin-independent methionine synthase II family protein [Hyphomicrobiales bacterium]|nr:cobalamin-independent methionine synthase II family protein [Hyphomicrobiales bacterium]